MNILVACEVSGKVRDAFRAQGHDAYSCDLLPNPSPYHIQGDTQRVLRSRSWDMVLAFPPCTHLASSGARWFPEKRRDGRQQEAVDFFLTFVDCAPLWAIENPVGIMSRLYRRPSQIIQPWQFGHGETKATCLWLGNLPLLVPTNIVTGREQRIWKMGPSPDRAARRSETFQGIADAMASQWSSPSLKPLA